MNLRQSLTAQQQHDLLRALKTATSAKGQVNGLADGEMSDLEWEFIAALNRLFLQLDLDVDVDSLEPISVSSLVDAFPDPETRTTVLDLCLLLSLVNGKIDAEQLAWLENLAQSFALSSLELQVVTNIHHKAVNEVSAVLDARGFGGLLKRDHQRKHPVSWLMQRARKKLGLNQANLVNKYRRYGEYSPGTLGREYYDFITRNQLSFPGENGSLAEHLVYHDLAHVLGGFETSGKEEILVVAFQAASQAYNPFYSLLTAICLFHFGLNTSGARVVRLDTMQWHPETFFQALRRGVDCKVDFSTAWDFSSFMSAPLDTVREKLGITPRLTPVNNTGQQDIA